MITIPQDEVTEYVVSTSAAHVDAVADAYGLPTSIVGGFYCTSRRVADMVLIYRSAVES
jgi:hypothetical protein